jgi:glucosamine-6-phosphate deaminase
MGLAAANQAALLIREKLEQKPFVNIILATGASQFEMLSALVKATDLDWSRVRMFHLDEYLDRKENHPASFRKYLKERFVDLVAPLKSTFYIQGDAPDIQNEIERLNHLIQQYPIDVAMIGIGENGHLAFNDPPADFETGVPYIIVELDDACRQQQFGEGWFPSLEAVPRQAISMSIKQIMKASSIVCTVPDARKAKAVAAAVTQAISNEIPATILQEHPHTFLYLDRASAKDLPT